VHDLRMKRALLVVVLTACGSDSSPEKPPIDAPDEVVPDGPPDAPMPPDFILTSTAYAEGGTIPAAQSCDGANESPPLSWSAGPAGTMSYAIIFTDKNNALLHWAIWDIPGSATGLPANVEKMFMPSNVSGAKQSSYQAATKGYLGPCPMPSGTTHTYEHVVYAIDVASLPSTSMMTTPGQAKTAIDAHYLASSKLSGMYTKQ
jgi:Raf kinase inhibitor-like YbhB/YbcL family protein